MVEDNKSPGKPAPKQQAKGKKQKVEFDFQLPTIDPLSQMLTEPPGLGHVNGNLSYEELPEKVPYLCGSFTGWRYKQMQPLSEWCRQIDRDPPSALEIGKSKGVIRESVTSPQELTELELAHFKVIESDIRRQYNFQWMRYLPKYLKFQKPLLVNAAQFENIDEDLIYPQFSDSEDSETPPSSKHTEPDAEESSQRSGKKVVAPPEPDESKWDKIYVLPLFIRPGKHTYLIKYKDPKEKNQRQTIRETERVRRILDSEESDQIVLENAYA